MTQGESRTERNVKRYLCKNKTQDKRRKVVDENCTFTPAVDTNSLQILERKKERDGDAQTPDVFQRLSRFTDCANTMYVDKSCLKERPKKPLPDEKECKFKPDINPISSELATRGDEEVNKKPVWESLYKLNAERQALLEKKRQEIQQKKQAEESKLCLC